MLLFEPLYCLFVIKDFFYEKGAELIDSCRGGKQVLICLLEMISTDGDYLSFVCV